MPFNTKNKLPLSFYQEKNVVLIAQQLLGKILVTQFNNTLTAARIVETEAYNGIVDKASHSYNNRRTKRTEIMYADGGVAYVYLCYGIHYLFNVVTHEKDNPQAVLIRAAEPLLGIETMQKRCNKTSLDNTLTKGPGNVTKALGISTQHTGTSLDTDEIFIVDDGYKVTIANVITTPRIGVAYAKEDALLPYRFFIKNNKYVSGTRQMNKN